jgi:hypothetical protein
MSETDGNDESLDTKKRKMQHYAKDSIAQFLKETKHHRFTQYPLEERIVQKKMKFKFATTGELRSWPGVNPLSSRAKR